MRGTVIRVKGVGLTIKPRPRSESGYRTPELPAWAVVILDRRKASARSNDWDVVFSAPLGGLRAETGAAGVPEVFGSLPTRSTE